MEEAPRLGGLSFSYLQIRNAKEQRIRALPYAAGNVPSCRAQWLSGRHGNSGADAGAPADRQRADAQAIGLQGDTEPLKGGVAQGQCIGVRQPMMTSQGTMGPPPVIVRAAGAAAFAKPPKSPLK